MAEAMISDQYRESLQSLDGLVNDDEHQEEPLQKEVEQKRVKHGPTTIIQLPDKRRKISASLTAKDVVDGKWKHAEGLYCCLTNDAKFAANVNIYND
jgi:hypothetical protein